MRTLSLAAILLIFSLVITGCSSTRPGLLRSGVSPQMRTVASIGDKTLPVVSGEPGAVVAADVEQPERTTNPEGRISGRVLDEQGEPVPNARVRLALGGASKGRVVRSTTDRSGGFTLTGLHPGRSYTIIAEWEDEHGVMTGRSKAQAPESSVKISLAPQDDEPAPPIHAQGAKRISPASNKARETADDEEERSEDDETVPAVNREDIPSPPAPEADKIAPRTSRRSPRSDAGPPPVEAPVPMTARWRRSDSGRPSRPDPPAKPEPEDRADPEPPAELPIDDGPNPLPPAKERGQALKSVAPPREMTAQASPIERPIAPSREMTVQASPVEWPAPAHFDPGRDLFAEEPTPAPSAPTHRETQPALTSHEPKSAPQPADGVVRYADPMALAGTPWASEETSAPPTVETRAEPRSKVVDAPMEPTPAPPPRRRATWDELTAGQPKPSAPSEASDPPVPAPLPAAARSGPSTLPISMADTFPPSNPMRAAPGGKHELLAYCRLDARHRQLLDFRLPDLQGRPVRFQDLDADLVLLDFWGTWCDPCVRSVPHLVELQKRLGEKRIKVVGIACEQGRPAERVARVDRAVKELGINYLVLMSGMDAETCPVQEAFHIQAFPTLILLDRQGQILWRDHGATQITLARLDRFLASAIRNERTRRF